MTGLGDPALKSRELFCTVLYHVVMSWPRARLRLTLPFLFSRRPFIIAIVSVTLARLCDLILHNFEIVDESKMEKKKVVRCEESGEARVTARELTVRRCVLATYICGVRS